MSKLKKAVKSAVMLLKSEKKVAVPKPVNTSELLKGKVALITGGSGGIGFAMAESFVKSGCKVIIAGTNEEKLQRRCEEVVSQTCVLPSSPLAGRRQCKEGVNMTETPPWGGG